MEFLKTVLGDDLFTQVEEKINAYNSDEANKDKQIKLANLGDGGYVSKDKYSALETEKGGIQEQLTAAQTLIDDLKKSGKGNEALQSKVTEYEDKVSQLTKELEQTKLDSALKLALLGAKATDVDYLMFKLKQENKELKLDEKGGVEGIDDMISSLKTQMPAQFESDIKNKKIDEKKLPGTNEERETEPQNLAEAIKQSYENNE